MAKFQHRHLIFPSMSRPLRKAAPVGLHHSKQLKKDIKVKCRDTKELDEEYQGQMQACALTLCVSSKKVTLDSSCSGSGLDTRARSVCVSPAALSACLDANTYTGLDWTQGDPSSTCTERQQGLRIDSRLGIRERY